VSIAVDLPEELPNAFHVSHGPEHPKHIGSTQCLGFRLFELVLFVPELSPLLHHRHASQRTRVVVVDFVQLGVLSVSVCVVKFVFSGKQVRQGDMNTR
jgi:hypothetical protein